MNAIGSLLQKLQVACVPSRRLLGAVATAAISLSSGCAKEDQLAWTEDIKVVGNGVITVKRKAEFRAPSELGQLPGESWYSLDFEHPVTKEKVHVESVLRAGGIEMEESAQSKRLLMQWPISLMLDHNDLFLVAHTHALLHEYLHCPNPPYQLYKWVKGHWEWIPLTEIPVRKFGGSFFDAESKRAREYLKGHSYRLSVDAANEFNGPNVAYDLTAMTQVSYASTRNCTRNIEWLASDDSLYGNGRIHGQFAAFEPANQVTFRGIA
jgi:hypothetical protein